MHIYEGLPACRAVTGERSGLFPWEVAPLSPKVYLRGKFELWFLITFLKHLRATLADEANRAAGSVTWTVPIEVSNVIAVMSPVMETPGRLVAFLTGHYPQQRAI